MSHQLHLPGVELPFDSSRLIDLSWALWPFPEVPHYVLSRHAKMLGQAGEHLVDSLLCRYGLISLPVPEVLPVDRLVVHPDRLVRIQVKTSSSCRDGAYHFSLHKGYQRGPTGIKPYAPNDFDIAAFVVLPENVVLFTASKQASCRIPISEIAHLRARPRDSLDEALLELGVQNPDDYDFLA